MGKADPQYRLVVFEAVDDPAAVRDLFCRVTGMHPTDAMQWVARAPGTWPKPLGESEVRALLDGLFELGVPAEAWRLDAFPDLGPPRNVHDAACLPDGFRVHGLRGEPTHWVPWNRVELISAGTVAAEDEFRPAAPPGWVAALATGLNAMVFRRAPLPPRGARAQRLPRDPVGEVHVVRRDPRLAFRIAADKMNYAYLGDRRSLSSPDNFRLFVADLVARSDDAYITPATRSFLDRADPTGHEFPTSQALLDYTTHRLLWSWYRRDREAGDSAPD